MSEKKFCIVKNCDAVYRIEDREYHSFPKNSEKRKKWMKSLGIYEVDWRSKVCDVHFVSNDYGLTKLKTTAVPTQYLKIEVPFAKIIETQAFRSYDFSDESQSKCLMNKLVYS